MSEPVVPPHVRIEPPRGLATAALALAGAVTGVQVVLAVIALTAGDLGGSGRVTSYDVVSIVWVPILVAAYVVTCRWLYQARLNSEVLVGAEDHARARKWVWLGWVVPVVSFWFPYQVVRDVQRTSVHAVQQEAVRLELWWACWILSLLMLRAHSRLAVPSPTFAVAIAVVMSIGLWRWILVVRRITDAQTALATGVPATPAG